MREPYYPACYALLSGGKDSISTAEVLAKADRLLGCVSLDTHISTPDWRDFVVDVCKERGWAHEFHHTPHNFEDLVIKYGFPGRSKHQMFMTYLKGYAIREFRRKHPNGILASGTRKNESNRRFINTKPVSFWEGVPILSPIYDWTTDETWAFFWANGFKRAPAYNLLMISGDCLCGAFAVKGEHAALRLAYPEMAIRFDALGKKIAEIHPKRCEWGWSCKEKKRPTKSAREAAICSECMDTADLFNEETDLEYKTSKAEYLEDR